MQRFTQLYYELDATTRTAEKVDALTRYFQTAAPADAVWGLYFLSGRKIKRAVNTKLLREWLAEVAGLAPWLIDESYDAVGDLAETLALLVPTQGKQNPPSLHEVVEQRIIPLRDMPPDEQRRLVLETWQLFDARERLVWHKLIMGEFRVGVAATLVARALARAADVPAPEMTHRLMGHWEPTAEGYLELLRGGDSQNSVARPYPFFLAHPLEAEPESLGDISLWQAEWKWDGIRAQLIRRSGETLVWSRGEELVTDRFPEVRAIGDQLPDGTALDGEILTWKDNAPLPFALLQKRIGRKTVGAKLLAEAPVAFMAYDVMEADGRDIRSLPLVERRQTLESLREQTPNLAFLISAIIQANSWQRLAELRAGARERSVEGLMLKRLDSAYGVGRPRGDWWKWKIAPHSIDAVLIYAQRGSGRRASLYTDYTFGVWHEGSLVPIAKAYSGLTDEEILQVDAFVRNNIVEAFGPVRVVRPELVFELHFEGIQLSQRHKAGLAVRFPRMARWRHDKPAAEADTLEQLRSLAASLPSVESI